jgi:tetratricopeptide (TPR) repeat protein
VAAHPGSAEARFYLGLTYQFEQRYERSSELFEQALELDPAAAMPRLFYGWALYYLGRPEAARAAFESFLDSQPDHPEALYALGLLDFDADDVESARERLVRVIELAARQQNVATEAKARARLADVFVRTGELTAARDQLEASIRLNPNNYEPYFKLSRVLQRLGDEEGAEAARRLHDQVRERMLAAERPDPATVDP